MNKKMYIIINKHFDSANILSDVYQAVSLYLNTYEIDKNWKKNGAAKIAVKANNAQFDNFETTYSETKFIKNNQVIITEPINDNRFKKYQAHFSNQELNLPNHILDNAYDVYLNSQIDLSLGKWLAHIGHIVQYTKGAKANFYFEKLNKKLLVENLENKIILKDLGKTEIAPNTITAIIEKL